MDPLVLLVEGSDTQRDVLRTRLEATGHVVSPAADVDRARQFLHARRFDLTLLDLGVHGAHELLDELNDAPVIVVAERDQELAVSDALARGAHDSLLRPVAGSELDTRVAAALRTKRLQDELRETRDRARDPATGLPGPERAREELGRMVAAARRHGRPFAVLACELDPVTGERGPGLPRAFGERITSGLRQADLVCRWTGERLLVLLPDCPADLVVLVGDRLRRATESADVGGAAVTLSAGWACWAGEDAQLLVERAEQALAAAQAAGRNAVHPLTASGA